MIFDLIASQYGYTFDQIRGMTFKEVYIAYTSILKRRKQEMIFQARCMGAQVKDDSEGNVGEYADHEQLTPDQESLMQKMMAESIAKKGLKKWRT